MKSDEMNKLASQAIREGYIQEMGNILKEAQGELMDAPYDLPDPDRQNQTKDLVTGAAIGAGLGLVGGAGVSAGKMLRPYSAMRTAVNEYAGKGSNLSKAMMKDIRGKNFLNVKGRLGKGALIGLPVAAVAGAFINQAMGKKKRQQMDYTS